MEGFHIWTNYFFQPPGPTYLLNYHLHFTLSRVHIETRPRQKYSKIYQKKSAIILLHQNIKPNSLSQSHASRGRKIYSYHDDGTLCQNL